MGNCKSNISILKFENSYLLFENCNDPTKARLYDLIDKRIQDAMLEDPYSISFSLKTFLLPGDINDKSFFTFYDVFINVETRQKDDDPSEKNDIYVPYSIIINRMKQFVKYSHTIHHTYWYINHDKFENNKYIHTTLEPYMNQNVENSIYRWFGLLHVNRVLSSD